MNTPNIFAFLTSKKFTCEENKTFTDFKTDLYATRKGRSALILPYTDYLFIYDFDKEVINLKENHEKARKYVNSLYKLPKSLRLSVPNIASIAISSNGFTPELIELAEENTRTIVGGEFHAMFLIDAKNKEVHSQGINLTYISGEAKLVLGNRFEFKNVNPQNRAYYVVKEMGEVLFK